MKDLDEQIKRFADAIEIEDLEDNKKAYLGYGLLFVAFISVLVFLFFMQNPKKDDAEQVVKGSGVVAGGNVVIHESQTKQSIHWEQLPSTEQEQILIQALLFFPEVYHRNEPGKYNRLGQWLRYEKNIAYNNPRDILRIDWGKHAIERNLLANKTKVFALLGRIDGNVLAEYWAEPIPADFYKRVAIWKRRLKGLLLEEYYDQIFF